MLNSAATAHWLLRNTAQVHEVRGLISAPGKDNRTNAKLYHTEEAWEVLDRKHFGERYMVSRRHT